MLNYTILDWTGLYNTMSYYMKLYDNILVCIIFFKHALRYTLSKDMISDDLPTIHHPNPNCWTHARRNSMSTASAWPSCSAQSKGVLWCWRQGRDGDGRPGMAMPRMPHLTRWEGEDKGSHNLNKIKYDYIYLCIHMCIYTIMITRSEQN